MIAAILPTLLILAASCSSKPFLVVNYQLAETSEALEGMQTAVTVLDVRENKAFLSAKAKNSLKDFNDFYSLVVLKTDGSGNLLGLYKVEDLIAEIFTQRLRNAGLQVSSPGERTANTLEIKLNQFKLDLADRKWVATMKYQANLLINGRFVATESVNGSAERLKITGKSGAEKILGELITDIVNKLDIATIFQRARL
jgi:hypothetical protein